MTTASSHKREMID